jgi:nicotinamidase-related amidase
MGLCTGICVMSNAILAKATLPEVPVNVVADCCACVTPESHKTALEAMKLCQINII